MRTGFFRVFGPLWLGILAVAAMLFTTSCETTYDRYGRPVQSVDPGLAIAGIAAAGLIGYAIADDDDDDYYRHGRHGYKRGYSSYGGGYGYRPNYGGYSRPYYGGYGGHGQRCY